MAQLRELIQVNNDFKNAVNLYLDLNKTEKINSYIPTKSSVEILNQYLQAVENNQKQATLLIGPYGKGKSHLLLVLLAILSLERTTANKKTVAALIKKIKKTDEESAERIDDIWNNKGRFLPVIIMSTQGDLNQAFMVGLFEALKREGLTDLAPKTYFTYAVDTIKRWEEEYPETYKNYLQALKKNNVTAKNMLKGLVNFENEYLDVFKNIYPELTSGEVFNPLVNSEVQPMYKNIADKLREEYGYSGIYIIFDEFSKYIEGQDKKASGNNMKMLQDVCELANSSKETQVFITMVAHKSIKEYGKYLSVETINQFTGIEGRIDEVMFVTSSKNNYELIKNAIVKDEKQLEGEKKVAPYWDAEVIDRYFEMVAFSSTFTRKDFEKSIVRGCYPLSPTSTYLLLNISEKVAQNERTLFTFISKDEQYSMANYVKNATTKSEWIINADLIYDYFKNLFKKDINNEFIHNEWLNAEYALSVVNDENEIRVLKTIAIINIVNKPDEFVATEKYITLASGVDKAKDVLIELKNKGLLYKKGSNDCYAFKTRATSELKTEIKKRKAIKSGRVNVNNVLNQLSEIKYILPREYNYHYSMTRYFRFEFMNVEEFLSLDNLNVLFSDGIFGDGKVVALYSQTEEDYSAQIQKKLNDAFIKKLVVVYGKNPLSVLKQIEEYEILQELKKDVVFFSVDENKVLLKEIPVIEEDLEKEIDIYIQKNFGNESKKQVYYISNDILVADEKFKLNDVVEALCFDIYNGSINISSELINKEDVKTGAIKKARKNLITEILNQENMDKHLDGTSADSTIYRALFVGTGISTGYYSENVENVINVFDSFISGASDKKCCLTELIDELTAAPIGMRRGVIPLYLADAISKRNEDIIIYFGDKEISLSADIILNMCESPKDYSIYISSEDANKEKYISALCELFRVQTSDNIIESRINNIVVAMQKWYRALPQVTKNIKKQTKYFKDPVLEKAYPKFKKLLQNIEPNSFEILFVDFPAIFETGDNYDDLISLLKKLKEKLRGYYEYLKKNAVKATIKVFDNDSKQDLLHTLTEWYDSQSDLAKNGLHTARVTNFMSCIANNKSYSDMDVIEKVVKSVTEIYMDSWNDNSLEQYISEIKIVKEEIESINDDENNDDMLKLSFVGKNGKIIDKYYEHVDEGTGSILRNILSDALEDFSDLSTNEKISILLEMIENELK